MGYNNLPQTRYSNTARSYSENSEQKANIFYHPGLKDCLEGLALKTRSDRKPGTLESMFSDKGKSLKASVNALLEEIKLREGIDSYQLIKVDSEICRQQNRLEIVRSIRVDMGPG
jgi:hypothetical protein